MYGVFKNFSPRNLQNLNHESFSVEAVSDMFFKGYKQHTRTSSSTSPASGWSK